MMGIKKFILCHFPSAPIQFVVFYFMYFLSNNGVTNLYHSPILPHAGGSVPPEVEG